MKIILLIFLTISYLSVSADCIYIKDLDTDFSKFSDTNYDKLYSAHIKAIEENKDINYEGIDTIKIDIPITAHSIPIPNTMDFKDVVFVVNNMTKDIALFEYSNKLASIEIDKKIIGSKNYSLVKEFNGKKILLVVCDQNYWVRKRVGYSRPHIRRDILLIDNGKCLNEPIMPYNNDYSMPICSYCDITNDSIVFSNINLYRTKNSTYKTFCLIIQNTSNVLIDNISIRTPKSNLYGDEALTFNNCANLRLSNVTINGTYSEKDKYGYGISMNNVYNCIFENLSGDGEWGIFGTNNINTAHLNNCNLNRFDIHCYGKDVFCSNTLFHSLYNQFSSFYGTLKYDGCTFIKFVPVTIEGSFSAYTSFNVIFKDCYLEIDPRRPFLFNMSHSRFLIDSVRAELNKLFWPNIFIDKMDIDAISKNDTYYLFHTYDNTDVTLFTMPQIEIQNLNTNFNKIALSNSEVKLNE